MTITAVLGSYARHHTLIPQIEALQAQTVKPDAIWVWSNPPPGVEKDFSRARAMGATVIEAGPGLGYYARSALCMLVQTDYLSIMDDDVLPGPRWFENCLSHMEKESAIYSAAGFRIIEPRNTAARQWYGWNVGGNDEPVEVDVGGHNWFLPSEAVRTMFLEDPVFPHSDDIHMAYTAKKYQHFRSIVPRQEHGKPETWGTDPFFGNIHGEDANASGRLNINWAIERAAMELEYINRGWKLVNA